MGLVKNEIFNKNFTYDFFYKLYVSSEVFETTVFCKPLSS